MSLFSNKTYIWRASLLCNPIEICVFAQSITQARSKVMTVLNQISRYKSQFDSLAVEIKQAELELKKSLIEVINKRNLELGKSRNRPDYPRSDLDDYDRFRTQMRLKETKRFLPEQNSLEAKLTRLYNRKASIENKIKDDVDFFESESGCAISDFVPDNDVYLNGFIKLEEFITTIEPECKEYVNDVSFRSSGNLESS